MLKYVEDPYFVTKLQIFKFKSLRVQGTILSTIDLLTKQKLSIRKQADGLKDLYNDEFSLNAWDEHSTPLLAWRGLYTLAIIGRKA